MSGQDRIIWGVHCGKKGDTLFQQKNHIGIGWGEVGSLDELGNSPKHLIKAVEECYPDIDHKQVPVIAEHMYRFRHDAKNGDLVIYPSEKDHLVHIGEIAGDYEWHPDDDSGYPHQREVKWLKEVGLQRFSNRVIYEIESPMSFFRMHDADGVYDQILESE